MEVKNAFLSLTVHNTEKLLMNSSIVMVCVILHNLMHVIYGHGVLNPDQVDQACKDAVVLQKLKFHMQGKIPLKLPRW